MNRTLWLGLSLFGTCAPCLAQAPAISPAPTGSMGSVSWKSVEKVLGPGEQAQGGVFQIGFPRTDLNVVVQGFALDSQGALVSQFTFEALPKGAQMTGRVFLMDPEVPQAMERALQNGLEITALYSPFLGESPGLKCLRLRGKGPQESLAWAAKMVLSATGTPLDLGAKGVSASVGNWKEVQSILGPGEVEGSTLHYEQQQPDPENAPANQVRLTLQKEGKQTIAWGEFEVGEDDAGPLVEEILKREVTATALFTEKSGQNPRSFIGFWVTGEEKKVAEQLEEILSQAGF